MPIEPFRFIHASNLLLDHQIRCTDRLSDDLLHLAEECTLLAFDQIIETCLAEDVDFLLLAGNSFDADDHSLQSQVALTRGLERLAEHQIAVVVVPGETDPVEAWRAAMMMPSNVVQFLNGNDEVHNIVRDGRIIVTIHGLPSSSRSIENVQAESLDGSLPTSRDKPFGIALMHAGLQGHAIQSPSPDFAAAEGDIQADGVDTLNEAETESRQATTMTQEDLACSRVRYWALGSGHQRRTVFGRNAIAHHPGAPQAINSDQIGPHGCTLVEVDSIGEMTLTFVPTAPVRWESLHVKIDEATDRERLLNLMQEALTTLHRHPTDQLWLLSWEIHGSGPLVDRLRDEAFGRELNAVLQQRFADCGVILVNHALRMIDPNSHAPIKVPLGELALEFTQNLTERRQHSTANLESVLDSSNLAGGPWHQRMKQLAGQLNEDDVFVRALRLGCRWFTEPVEEST